MKKNILRLSIITASVTLWACNGNKKEENTVKNTGIDVSNIDSAAKPTDDFFQFVNGNWIKNNPIPESESHFFAVSNNNEEALVSLMHSKKPIPPVGCSN